MSEPHHYVFYVLQQGTVIKGIKMEALLPHLADKKVVPDCDIKRYESHPKNGMRILISYLRNQSYQTFLDFVECIFLAQRDSPAKVQSTVVDAMIVAIQDFDERNSTIHAEKIIDIQQKYMKQVAEGDETEAKVLIESNSLSPSKETSLTLPTPLHYVETPVTMSFQSQGGQFPEKGRFPLDKYHGLSILVPPLAVAESNQVTLRIGVCCYGPFSISEQYQIASDFIVIAMDRKFDKPVKVVMDHCLILPKYEECSEVIILKASHTKVTEDGLYTFHQFTYPEISPDSPEVSFELEEFCILCAVLDKKGRIRTSSTDSASSSRVHIDDSNPSSAHSSCDEEDRSFTNGNQTPLPNSIMSTSTESLESVEKPELLKDLCNFGKPQAHVQDTATGAKLLMSKAMKKKRKPSRAIVRRHYGIEYAVLLFQDKKKIVDIENQTYQFVIFVCTNCGGAHKICRERAKDVLGPEVELSSTVVITINSDALQLEVSATKKGWEVVPEKNAEIYKSEVQFHTMSRKDLFSKMELKTCPPRLVFTAEYDESYGPICSFSCKIKIKGAATRETCDEVPFFNIRASIPRAPPPIMNHPAMDYSRMGQYPPPLHWQPYYLPHLRGPPFLPPPPSPHAATTQPQSNSSQLQENRPPMFESARVSCNQLKYLPWQDRHPPEPSFSRYDSQEMCDSDDCK